MKKFLKLILIVLLLVVSKNSWALEQTGVNKNVTDAVPLATINIREAKIVSQDGNNFKISFFITNNEGLQPEVKYGVRLYTQDEKGQLDLVVGEKIYDEKINISPNARINKEIEYVAPDVLDGEYRVAILSYNSKGLPLAFANIGKVKLTRVTKGIEILNDSCFVKINKEETKHKINEYLAIKPEDNLYLNCSITNHDNKSVMITPVYETRLGSAYGEVMNSTGGDGQGITLKASEKKDISVLIPTKSIEPQVYNLSFLLKDEEHNSNQVKLDYRINGISATLYDISLDKSNYKDGEIAKVTALLKLNRAEASESNPLKYYLNVNILNEKNIKCGKQFIKEVDNNFVSNFDIKISNKCGRPQIIASITDSNGKVLSQMGNSNVKKSLSLNNLEYIISIIALIILITLIFINKKNKKDKLKTPMDMGQISNVGTVASFMLLVAVSVFTNLLFTTKASANLYSVDSYGTLATIDIDKSQYDVGETITVSAMVTPLTPVYYDHETPSYSLTAENIGDPTIKTFASATTFSTVTFKASSTPTSSGRVIVGLKKYCNVFGERADSKDGGCVGPSLKQISNTLAGVNPTYRIQGFRVGESVMPGDEFCLTVFSHSVCIIADSSDVQTSIIDKLIAAVNATTATQWNDHGTAPLTIGTANYPSWGPKPSADEMQDQNVIGVRLDLQHQFAADGVNYTDNPRYYDYKFNYIVVPAPTLSVTSSSPSVNSGNCVDIDWNGVDLNNCTLTKTDLVTSSSVNFTPGDMRIIGTYHDCPINNTKYTAVCSNIKPSCTGKVSSDNAFCYSYSNSDQSCLYDTNSKCNWNN